MFRSKRTFEEYQHLLENEGGAPNDFTVHDIDETYSEEDNHYNHDYGDDDDSDVDFDLDPSLIPVPEGFNDDEEVIICPFPSQVAMRVLYVRKTWMTPCGMDL
ncbi:unnamed protein product [Cuscuta campestris]|uniref:Uncharacterized protein n=1 Tax=Cuscuta campestris TaxID=132261 RepID=A0A484M812_9ASTE|nr:unnamed protein product [Cuscuta campestris]